VPIPAQAFSDFERSAVQGDARPFNTGRTLIDARTAETWRSLTNRAVRRLGANDLGYADPAGLIELRGNICDYLRAARAVRCDPEQIVITAGTQQAVDIAIRVLLVPGDEVWVEDPGYPLTHAQLLLAKARLHPIPVDAHGLVVDAGMCAHRGRARCLLRPRISFRPVLPCPWGGAWSSWRGHGGAARSSSRTITPASSAIRDRRSHRCRGSMTPSK
jgi:DNA-binding transcriptional MocR family regulator